MADLPQIPLMYSTTPQMQALETELNGIANVSPAAINMAAKQYFAPIVQPLVQEGGQRMQEYIGGIQGFMNAPVGETNPLYTNGINTTIQNMGMTAGQLANNQGMRDYYGTRAEQLGALSLESLKFTQAAKKALYDQINQRLSMTNQNRVNSYNMGMDQIGYQDQRGDVAFTQGMQTKQYDRGIFESDRDYALRKQAAARAGAASAGNAGFTPADLDALLTQFGFGTPAQIPATNVNTGAPIGYQSNAASYPLTNGNGGTIVGTNRDGTPIYSR